jgi:hypothetical protein
VTLTRCQLGVPKTRPEAPLEARPRELWIDVRRQCRDGVQLRGEPRLQRLDEFGVGFKVRSNLPPVEIAFFSA